MCCLCWSCINVEGRRLPSRKGRCEDDSDDEEASSKVRDDMLQAGWLAGARGVRVELRSGRYLISGWLIC